MPGPMPTTIPTGGSDKLGSTAKIMVDLFQKLHEAEDIAKNNPAITKGTRLDGLLGKLKAHLHELDGLNAAQSNVNHIIDTLQNGSRESQQAASVFSSKHTSLDEQVNAAHKTADSLSQQLTELRKFIDNMLKFILSTLKTLDEEARQEKSRSMEITSQFDTALKNTEKLESQLQKFVQNCKSLNSQLNDLHTSLYAALPVSDKKSAPIPPSAAPGQRNI